MSGSGGYYKYRCKYWLTYNCSNWVWVNNAPCAHCLVSIYQNAGVVATFAMLIYVDQADGRDSDTDTVVRSSRCRLSREVYVPQVEDEPLHYILILEIVAAKDIDRRWAVKGFPFQPVPTAPVLICFEATDGSNFRNDFHDGFQKFEQ